MSKVAAAVQKQQEAVRNEMLLDRLADRFVAQVRVDPTGEWIWDGTVQVANGKYLQGIIVIDGRRVTVRRAAWYIEHGHWPEKHVRTFSSDLLNVSPWLLHIRVNKWENILSAGGTVPSYKRSLRYKRREYRPDRIPVQTVHNSKQLTFPGIDPGNRYCNDSKSDTPGSHQGTQTDTVKVQDGRLVRAMKRLNKSIDPGPSVEIVRTYTTTDGREILPELCWRDPFSIGHEDMAKIAEAKCVKGCRDRCQHSHRRQLIASLAKAFEDTYATMYHQTTGRRWKRWEKTKVHFRRAVEFWIELNHEWEGKLPIEKFFQAARETNYVGKARGCPTPAQLSSTNILVWVQPEDRERLAKLQPSDAGATLVLVEDGDPPVYEMNFKNKAGQTTSPYSGLGREDWLDLMRAMGIKRVKSRKYGILEV